MSYSKLHSVADLWGAAISSICVIHCVLTPVFFAAQPLLSLAEQDHDAHVHWHYLDCIFLVLSLVAVWYSARNTLRWQIRFLLWFFWLVFAVGLVLHMAVLVEHKYLMYIGSLALAITHVTNYRQCSIYEKSSNKPFNGNTKRDHE